MVFGASGLLLSITTNYPLKPATAGTLQPDKHTHACTHKHMHALLHGHTQPHVQESMAAIQKKQAPQNQHIMTILPIINA